MYGNPPQMKNFDKLTSKMDEYFFFITYFEPPIALMYSKLQDLKVIYTNNRIKK